jgi:hypothetical protein
MLYVVFYMVDKKEITFRLIGLLIMKNTLLSQESRNYSWTEEVVCVHNFSVKLGTVDAAVSYLNLFNLLLAL